jgi:hypothetical protein
LQSNTNPPGINYRERRDGGGGGEVKGKKIKAKNDVRQGDGVGERKD